MKEGDVLAHGGIICLAGYSDILPTFVDKLAPLLIQPVIGADIFGVFVITAAVSNIAICILVIVVCEGLSFGTFTYRDDEYVDRNIRACSSYREYAKDICNNYRLDLRRYKLIKERRQYIGVSGKDSFSAMCEDISFLQQSLKTVLVDHNEIFQTRYAKGLSVRDAAKALQVNRGVIERRQAALLDAFSQLLYERDQAAGTCRLCKKLTNLEEASETE